MSDQSTITCHFDNENALYLAYMSFILGGGVFVRTKTKYALGERVQLCIQLMDEDVQEELEGRIVWITPPGAQGNKPAGVGVQFISDHAGPLCNKIETYLVEKIKSTQATDTM